jgi:hypothetical protein
VQNAALEALTSFCEKHTEEVTGTAARVIPVPERHFGPRIEREAQYNSQYSLELVASVRFSEAMFDTYRRMVG